jgi:hypothetical protein
LYVYNQNIIPLTSHLSPLTSHLSPLTSHLSPLTSHLSPLNNTVAALSNVSSLQPTTDIYAPQAKHASVSFGARAGLTDQSRNKKPKNDGTGNSAQKKEPKGSQGKANGGGGSTDDSQPAGKTFSGKFPLRTSPELHEWLAGEAKRKGKSMNAVMNDIAQNALRPPAYLDGMKLPDKAVLNGERPPTVTEIGGLAKYQAAQLADAMAKAGVRVTRADRDRFEDDIMATQLTQVFNSDPEVSAMGDKHGGWGKFFGTPVTAGSSSQVTDTSHLSVRNGEVVGQNGRPVDNIYDPAVIKFRRENGLD